MSQKNRIIARLPTGVLCVLAGLTMLTAPPAAAQAAPPDSVAVAQQQIRNAREGSEALTAQDYIPSVTIPWQFGDATLTEPQRRMAFSVSRIEVAGSSVYGAESFAPLLQQHLGRANTLAELRDLAARIEAKYQQDGYPFTAVRLPGQQIVDGLVTLQVSEFSVTSVQFILDGKEVPAPAALQPVVAAIMAERPVRIATLEAAQARATLMPDYRIATFRFDRTRNAELRLALFLARDGTDVVAIQQTSVAGAPADDAQRIALRSVRVTGSTALGPADLVTETAGLAGRDVTLRELRAAAAAIEARYAAAGYFGTTAFVPPQVVNDGVVTIEVAELTIARVGVLMNGRSLQPDNMLGRIANVVTTDQPATTASVQRQLYILNRIPGVRVESIIPPVLDDPEALIYLRRQPFVFTTALDNRGTSVAGPLQWGAMVTTNDLLGLNEQIQLQGLTSIPFGQVRFVGGLLILPLTPSGLTGTLNISRSEAFPAGYLRSTEIAAYGEMFSAGLTYPLLTRPDLAVVATLNFEAFNNSSSIFNGARTTSDERSRALRIGATATASDRLGGSSRVRLVFSQGLNAFGSRPNSLQVNTRPGMQLDASRIAFHATRTQTLPAGFRLTTDTTIQRASGPLPAAEVMIFGGVTYGRAFDSGIISGDHGIAGKIQLSRPILLGNPILPLVDPYVFYDVGEMYSALKTAGRSSSASAASAGFGMRFVTGLGLGGSIEASLPMMRAPTVEPGRGSDRSPRLFFLLFMQF